MMKILDLPLKAKWFDMIESGVKKEEYREIKPYWVKRLTNCGGLSVSHFMGYLPVNANNYTHVRFRYGYTRRTMLFVLDDIYIGRGYPGWGAPGHDVFILKLGGREPAT